MTAEAESRSTRVLVVTAVGAESSAVLNRAHRVMGTERLTVTTGGVGMAAAAAATATAIVIANTAGRPYTLVVSAGIGGGFAPAAPVGSLAVADGIIAADLGAETPNGFVPIDELGIGKSTSLRADEADMTGVTTGPTSRIAAADAVSARVAEAFAAQGATVARGPILTVSTITGSAARAAELTARHPGCVAEAMEGYGVAVAAVAHGIPVAEVRAISNAVGPRDREAWRIGEALESLGLLVPALSST